MRVTGMGGFTVVEALLAMVVLSVGLLALAGSAALTTRMLGRGAGATRAALAAAGRIERLRVIAHSTIPTCTSADWRGGSEGGAGLTEAWELPVAAGPARLARIVLYSRHPAGTSVDTVVAGFLCDTP